MSSEFREYKEEVMKLYNFAGQVYDQGKKLWLQHYKDPSNHIRRPMLMLGMEDETAFPNRMIVSPNIYLIYEYSGEKLEVQDSLSLESEFPVKYNNQPVINLGLSAESIITRKLPIGETLPEGEKEAWYALELKLPKKDHIDNERIEYEIRLDGTLEKTRHFGISNYKFLPVVTIAEIEFMGMCLYELKNEVERFKDAKRIV